MPSDVAARFAPDGIHLNTAMYGLPPREAWDALAAAAGDWRAGRVASGAWAPPVEASRAALARLHGVAQDAVTLGTSVSSLMGPLVASLPAGSRVLVPEDEFLSVVFPLRARAERGDVELVTVPVAELAAAATSGDATLVVASLVRPQDGRLLDAAALVRAARDGGATVTLDVTQAGWMDLRGVAADVLVGAGHKWLMAPHGTAFMITAPEARERLVALTAGWTARADVTAPPWGNDQARRAGGAGLDQSPVFLAWVAQAASLALVEELGLAAIAAHDLGLAGAFASALGLSQPRSPIVAVPADDALLAALERAGVQFTARAGLARFSFHLHNGVADAERAAAVVLETRARDARRGAPAVRARGRAG
jgi:selenocysteine lyase/cysteine desulfurase